VIPWSQVGVGVVQYYNKFLKGIYVSDLYENVWWHKIPFKERPEFSSRARSVSCLTRLHNFEIKMWKQILTSKKHRVWKLYFWPPLYAQLTVFLFELPASLPSGRHSLWNITFCIIKLFIIMMSPSIFQSAYTERISVPCSQYIIYLVVQGALFLGRSSLFPKPPRSPYILPSCLVQHPYYVIYVITVSKELYGKP